MVETCVDGDWDDRADVAVLAVASKKKYSKKKRKPALSSRQFLSQKSH
jgi:hypothetical protein